MDFNTYLLVIPLVNLLQDHYKGYQTLFWAGLNDRYITENGKVFFKPYYTLPLNNNYDVEIVINEDGSVDHLTYEGGIEYCQDIIDYFNIENPQLTLVEDSHG